MSLFDVLQSGSFSSALGTLTGQARSAASDLQRKTPGGVGGLVGAGVLGALLGNVVSSDMVKNVALLGAGAVAWNFYQKWSNRQSEPSGQEAGTTGSPVSMQLDPTAELVMRTMIFAARADGTMDAIERQRIDGVLQNMLGNRDVAPLLAGIQQETLDPGRIASGVHSTEQAEDLYRLSCVVIDIDHFMERGYLDALARALHIADARKAEIEMEAGQARQQLMAAIGQ